MEQCSKCGHIFYNKVPLDSICYYCKSEPEEKCYVCGKVACCSGSFGYLCNSKYCIGHDELAAHRKYLKEVEREDPDGCY